MSAAVIEAVGGIFLLVALISAVATYSVLSRTSPEQRRIRSLASPGTGVIADTGLTETFDPTLVRLSRLLPKSPQDMSRLQKQLARAGFTKSSAAVYYSLAQYGGLLVLGILALLVFGLSGGWMYAGLAAVVGYTLPGFYVQRQRTLRQKAIRNGLPDALDLLTVCVEAGSGLDQAIVKATDELDIAHPALAEELRTVTTEIRAGKPRMEAFKNFAQRTGVDDVRSLVSMLVQTDRFGTSISQALRSHADTSRTKRRQRAEERAAKIAVKLVFPLALCLFPALYIVCFGPVAIKIYRVMFEGSP